MEAIYRRENGFSYEKCDTVSQEKTENAPFLVQIVGILWEFSENTFAKRGSRG